MQRSLRFCLFLALSLSMVATPLTAQDGIAMLGQTSERVVTTTDVQPPALAAAGAAGPMTAGDYAQLFPNLAEANRLLATEAGRREFLERFGLSDWTRGTNIQLMSMNPETGTFRTEGPPTHLFFGLGMQADDPRRLQLQQLAGMSGNTKQGEILNNLTDSPLGQAVRNHPLGVSFLTELPQSLDDARNPSSMFGSVIGLGVVPNVAPVMNQHQIQVGENLVNEFLATSPQLRQNFSGDGANVSLNGATVDFRTPQNGHDATVQVTPSTGLSMCQGLPFGRSLWATGLNTSLTANIDQNDRGTFDLTGGASGTASLPSNQRSPLIQRISTNIGADLVQGQTCQMSHMAESTLNGAISGFSDTPCPADVWSQGSSFSSSPVYGQKGLRGHRYGIVGANYYASANLGFSMQGINPNTAIRNVLQMPPTEQPILPITGMGSQNDRFTVTATLNPNNQMVGTVNNTANTVIDGIQAFQ